MKGVFLDLASLAEQDLDLGAFAHELDDWRTFPATAPDQRLAHIADAEVVVTNKVVLDESVLRAAPNIRLICLTATGYNNVAVDIARELGIVVSNVVAYATDSVAQHVFALMLAHHTRLFDYTAAVRNGDWSRSPQFCLLDFPVRELRGMTLGIVGFGELGQGVARIAEAFGMRVMVSQRPGGRRAGGAPSAGRGIARIRRDQPARAPAREYAPPDRRAGAETDEAHRPADQHGTGRGGGQQGPGAGPA